VQTACLADRPFRESRFGCNKTTHGDEVTTEGERGKDSAKKGMLIVCDAWRMGNPRGCAPQKKENGHGESEDRIRRSSYW